MPILTEDTRRRIAERQKKLDLTNVGVASVVGTHHNTVANALAGKSVNRNTAARLEQFANGEIAAAETVVELSPQAAEQIRSFAANAKVAAGEWESALHYWISTQSPQFRRFIQESVEDAIQAARMPGIAIRRRGANPTSSPRADGEGLAAGSSSKG